MSDQGYVYILINSSMPGLIKVGKTTKAPNERADELSKATGVPTPFVVGYQMAVNNCTKAEQFVHTCLESKGHRINDNREFFNASMTEAINAILEYKRTLDDSDNDNEEVAIVNNNSSVPWLDVEQMANEYFLGSNNRLQDYSEALKYYKQAIKLGSPTACRALGDMYFYGSGCNVNIERALENYKEGINRGSYSCYGNMMDLYFDIGHIENASKCWDLYSEYIQYDAVSFLFCRIYFMASYKFNFRVKNIEKMLPIKDEIIKEQKRLINNNTGDYILSNVLRYMQYVFSNSSQGTIMCGQDYIQRSNEEANEIRKQKIEKANRKILGSTMIVFIISLVICSNMFEFGAGMVLSTSITYVFYKIKGPLYNDYSVMK